MLQGVMHCTICHLNYNILAFFLYQIKKMYHITICAKISASCLSVMHFYFRILGLPCSSSRASKTIIICSGDLKQ